MAYAKRSLKKKTTKKRSSMKRKAPKARVTSRGRNQNDASHRQTGYVRALLDPKDGPLVGVPQFVPIDTHRVRARAVGTFTTGAGGSARIFFNPCRMVANDTSPIEVYGHSNSLPYVGTIDDSAVALPFNSNVSYAASHFQVPVPNGEITNGDGVKARVVGAMIRVCNVSSVQTRGGVFTALHEPHHKTLETFTLDDLSKNTKSIIRPAGDGGYISLLYRPVKPEEVEDWQTSAYQLPGQSWRPSGTLDGTVQDSYPGYMAIDFQGGAASTIHVEAYAIIEYAGEALTTLVRPIHLGGGKAATPNDGAKGAKDAGKKEELQGTDMDTGTPDPFATPVPGTPVRPLSKKYKKQDARDLPRREQLRAARLATLERQNTESRRERLAIRRAVDANTAAVKRLSGRRQQRYY